MDSRPVFITPVLESVFLTRPELSIPKAEPIRDENGQPIQDEKRRPIYGT